MGFLTDLFRGTKPKLMTRQLDLTSKRQQETLDALLSRLSGTRAQSYGGQFTSQMTGLEGMSLSALEERSKALALPDANLETAGGSLRELLDFEGQTADTNEFFEANVQNPLLQSFQREILPQISRQFGGNEFFSSERQATEGLAREDLLETLTGAKTAVSLDAFNQSRNRALQAAGLAPQLSDAEGRRTQSQMDILDAAGLPREIEQGDLDKRYADFIRMISQDQDLMQLLGQLATASTKENIGAGTQGTEGLISKFLGSLVSAGGTAIGGKASDRRLKTDIKYLGMAPDGYPIYRYRYKWDPPWWRRIGVMAQDLLLLAPQLVLRMPNGFLAVNYTGLAKWHS